jgi:hypothetical protein
LRTHRGDVGQVRGSYFGANVFWFRPVGTKVTPGNCHVGRRYDLAATDAQDGSIITDADDFIPP